MADSCHSKAACWSAAIRSRSHPRPARRAAHRLPAGVWCAVDNTPRRGGAYRAAHAGCSWRVNQSGKRVAELLSVKRMVSPTHSKRFMSRTRASTCVEFVRCLPPTFSHWCSWQHVSRCVSRRSLALPATNRCRNADRIRKSNPASVSSNPSRYFQSIRFRTASAAWRLERFSANCSNVTIANCQDAYAACPRCGNRSAKRASA